ncbi:hypothetical protein ACFOWE_32480 [Planomonospora corallina]|uniref:Uncharacterized protein n=1 Tax=Planomonospora corallina TaxID=1806052 RepID=A0ABV8IFW5_9ACTN
MIAKIAVCAVVGIPTALLCGAVVFAARSAPLLGRYGQLLGRYGHVRRDRLALGAALSALGVAVVALTAWSTHEDQHYDDFGSAMTVLAGVVSGALAIFGLGFFVPWLMGVLGRNTARLPRAFRAAARHLADRSYRTAPGVAMTMAATAVAVAVLIIGSAVAAQDRTYYRPAARMGALVVGGFPGDQAAAVRAAVRHELPGVPVTESGSVSGPGFIAVETAHSVYEEYEHPCGDPDSPHGV